MGNFFWINSELNKFVSQKKTGSDKKINQVSFPTHKILKVFLQNFQKTGKVRILYAFMRYCLIEFVGFGNFADFSVMKKTSIGSNQMIVMYCLDNGNASSL